MTKLFNQVLESPHRDHKFDKGKSEVCPLCGYERCDAEHILMSCTDNVLTQMREQLNEDMLEVMEPKRRPYWGVDTWLRPPLRWAR